MKQINSNTYRLDSLDEPLPYEAPDDDDQLPF